jgi:hypothetical protein
MLVLKIVTLVTRVNARNVEKDTRSLKVFVNRAQLLMVVFIVLKISV